MNGAQLLADGFKLMVLGMGTVLGFLVLMIIFMNILAKVLAPFSHLLAAPAPAPVRKPSAASSDETELAAVAAAAVRLYREQSK